MPSLLFALLAALVQISRLISVRTLCERAAARKHAGQRTWRPLHAQSSRSIPESAHCLRRDDTGAASLGNGPRRAGACVSHRINSCAIRFGDGTHIGSPYKLKPVTGRYPRLCKRKLRHLDQKAPRPWDSNPPLLLRLIFIASSDEETNGEGARRLQRTPL